MQQAKQGDVVLVYKGLYKEGEIVITIGITLRGVGYPIIDAQNKFQAISVEANNAVVEGFEVRNAGYSSLYDWAAIKVINSGNVTIRNNRLTGNNAGIYLQNVVGGNISNNTVQGNSKGEVESGNAIHCWKSNGLRISNNVLTNHRDGLYFEFVSSSVIENNSSYNNLRYGIHFMFSNDNVYTHNTFRNNGSGVAVMFSKNVTMRFNTFEQNWGSAAYGILLKEIQGGVIEENRFIKNTIGIYMEGTSRMMINRNIFRSNGWAMKVQSSCDDNTVTHNNFEGNTFDIGTNGTLQLNKFYENYWDKYEGYDLNKDGYGDIQYQPVSLFSMIVEKLPAASILLRSFMVSIMDKAERLLPGITPLELKDDKPLMKPLNL